MQSFVLLQHVGSKNIIFSLNRAADQIQLGGNIIINDKEYMLRGSTHHVGSDLQGHYIAHLFVMEKGEGYWISVQKRKIFHFHFGPIFVIFLDFCIMSPMTT